MFLPASADRQTVGPGEGNQRGNMRTAAVPATRTVTFVIAPPSSPVKADAA
jgi:hypothetical protein